MQELTEKTQEQNSEYTVIGKFGVDNKDIGILVEVRDYSNDASRIEFHTTHREVTSEWGFIDTKMLIEASSPQHANAIMYNLMAAFANDLDVNVDWLKEHGWLELGEDDDEEFLKLDD